MLRLQLTLLSHVSSWHQSAHVPCRPGHLPRHCQMVCRTDEPAGEDRTKSQEYLTRDGLLRTLGPSSRMYLSFRNVSGNHYVCQMLVPVCHEHYSYLTGRRTVPVPGACSPRQIGSINPVKKVKQPLPQTLFFKEFMG